MKKDMIVIIDNDLGFIQKFTEKIDDQLLSDKYTIEHVMPITTYEQPRLITDCIDRVKRLIDNGNIIKLILVDIVIIESGPLDRTGIEIAKALKGIYSEIQIGRAHV